MQKVKTFLKKYRTISIVIPAVLSVFALLISYRSLGISEKSLSVAEGVREDNRKIEKLDLEPEIKFRVQSKKIGETPPYFIISNAGPIEAVQVVVKFISHWYNSETEKIGLSISGSEETYKVETLLPLQSKAFILSEWFLEKNARTQEPIENNILEALITYRKEPDRKLFAKRTFYFVSPEGIWVSERSNTLESAIYEKMKEAMLEYNAKFLDASDVLYDVDLNKLNQD